jgi:hypothetical protein
MLFIIAKVGLILNILGTVMIVLSFGKNLANAYQLDEKGSKYILHHSFTQSFFIVV